MLRTCFQGWVWKMAWRDSRRYRRRLAIFMLSIVLGVGALVAIQSYQADLQRAISMQAKELLGADLMVRSRTPFSDEAKALREAFSGESSEELGFASMALFPDSGRSRLVFMRGMSGRYPYYGVIQTEPPEAATTYLEKGEVLVEEGLMLQMEAKPGDPIQLGSKTFTIAGTILAIPGESAIVTQMAPRVLLPLEQVEQTGLLGFGSRVRYKWYFKTDNEAQLQTLKAQYEAIEDDQGLRVRTVEDQQRRLGRSMRNIYGFLNLFGIAALLLGGIGVGSAVTAYMQQKIRSVAILRCVGAERGQSTWIYLVQMLVMGLVGSLAGLATGMVFHRMLPMVMSDFVPATVETRISWLALLNGMVIGTGLTVIFTLLPMLKIRQVPALLALRSDIEPPKASWRDPMRLAALGVMLLGLVGFISLALKSLKMGTIFSLSLMVLFGVLSAGAWVLMWLLRRLVGQHFPFIIRQGFHNLYRPHNQTGTLMLSLGLGTFLIATMLLVRGALLGQVNMSHDANQPNMILFDIQPDQVGPVSQLLAERDLKALMTIPMVTMRISEINGISVDELRKDKSYERWSLNREYRSSYNDTLAPEERIIRGEMVPRVADDDEHPIGTIENPVPVTIEEGIAKTLKVDLGASILFDVQGLPVYSRIAGIREVNWYRMQPNFFFLFPKGILEEAPQIYVMATRVLDAPAKADLQRASIETVPNVSLIDVTLIVRTLDDVFQKISFVIQFMSIFSIGTGVIVLIGSLATNRFQRLREQVLLRTLGARKGQITAIAFFEFLILGTLASVAGIALALIASWGLARYYFEVTWLYQTPLLVISWLVVTATTIAIGMLNSQGAFKKTPLELLRQT